MASFWTALDNLGTSAVNATSGAVATKINSAINGNPSSSSSNSSAPEKQANAVVTVPADGPQAKQFQTTAMSQIQSTLKEYKWAAAGVVVLVILLAIRRRG